MSILDDSNYWEEAFQVWYLNNQPQELPNIINIIPNTTDGIKPSPSTVKSAMVRYGWTERADALNAQASQKSQVVLIEHKAAMLARQAEHAQEIANKAREHIIEHGFDTSSSAVQAYFKAAEEERTVRGVSDMLIKISRMSPEQLIERASNFLKRKNEAVDAEVVEDERASFSSTTSE